MKTIRLKPLLLVAFLNETGYSMMWPLATIYINRILHQSLTTAGLALFIFSVANVCGSVIAGKLYDRFNQFYLTLAGFCGALASCGAGLIYSGWPDYVLVLSGLGLATGWLTTAVNVYGTLITGMSTSKVFNELYLVINVGLVLGTILISELFRKSLVPIFALMIGFYLISLVLGWLYFPRQKLTYASGLATSASPKKPASLKISWTFGLCLVTLVIMWTMYTQWESNFSVYLLDRGFPLQVYSLLWTLNGIIIIIVQGVFAKWPRLMANLHQRIWWGLVLLTLSYFITVWRPQLFFIYGGMVLLTVGEALYIPSVPVVIDQESAPAVKGRNQGLINGFSSLGRALGPLFGGLVIDHASFQILFWLAGGLMLAVTIINGWSGQIQRKVN
ncbi:MFS transporter [Lactobacillus sp. DCY120]|uniref:MFS transporter n=1 Tax=Bombilactobacillus apium TaxID=2675299 RepID=A0A850R6I7_9LACO|nr:MFS transporter [Bombilactobacillus apium]NVY96252.1 MFS transporter [Bombilactobacillus apium]